MFKTFRLVAALGAILAAIVISYRIFRRRPLYAQREAIRSRSVRITARARSVPPRGLEFAAGPAEESRACRLPAKRGHAVEAPAAKS